MAQIDKSKEELIEEINFLNQRIAELGILTGGHKKLEEVLKEGEERYRSLFNNAEVGMFLSRLDGSELLDLNDKFCSILGRTRGEIIGKPSVVLWADLKEREEIVKLLTEQGHVSGFEGRLLNKAGEARTCIISLKACLQAGILEGSLVDITERKQNEEALKKSEAIYRTVVDHIPQKIFLLDLDLVYVSCNRSYAEDLSMEPEDVPGKNDFMFYPRELAEKFRADDKRIIETGKTEVIEENVFLRGKPAWVRTIKTPVRKANGEICGILGIFEDITEHRRVQKELQDKVESLEKMNKVMHGRELRVMELKKEINSLCREAGKPEPYSGGI